MDQNLTTKEAFELYENGKHRRYSLLFAVNGGAFAIAKLLMERIANPEMVLGSLRLWQLSVGMVLFTIVMVWDIFEFGLKMQRTYLPHEFGPRGRIVLLLLGGLIALGWIVVSLPQPAPRG
jgi:hypothetical protein